MAAVFSGRLPGRMVPVPQPAGEGYIRGMAEGLVDDALAFGEPYEGGNPVRNGVGSEIETQTDGLETDGRPGCVPVAARFGVQPDAKDA
jgi:hypothetical protein